MDRRIVLGGFAAIVLGTGGLQPRAQTVPRAHRVAFQVDDGGEDLMNEVLNNINNMYPYYQSRGRR